MRHLSQTLAALTALAILPTTAMVEDWQSLDAASIKSALTARVVVYDGGDTQQFNGDGSTIYTTDRASTGAWRVDGPQYCSPVAAF